ncbi:MAG: thiamine pyrophosphate-binding protein [Nitrososphaerota archaeon]|nr:thiamine pyrophosphate-binding protein [Nitrososphaerota archaeon]
MKVSELLVSAFESYGVKRAYGLIGTSVLDLMDALSRSKIRYVSTRHEQVAVSMADAEGRVTGRPGVALVHGGPGFLNSLVALGNAWKDGSPMVLVAGAVKRRMVGMDSWLEVPQLEMAASMVKKGWRIGRGQEAGMDIAEAFALASSAPKGPVYLEVPEDVWQQEAGSRVAELPPEKAHEPEYADVLRAADALKQAKRPLLVLGGGVNSSEGASAAANLLARVAAPVVSTSNGRGVIPEDHPMTAGRIGFGGLRMADALLTQADVVLCLGCGLSDVSTYGYNATPKGEVLAVNMDPIWDRKPVAYALHSYSDAARFADTLAGLLEGIKASPEWSSRVEAGRASWAAALLESQSTSQDGYVNPARFLAALDGAIPRDTIFAAGQGLHQVYAYALLKVRKERSFLAAANMGAMGFVFPAALGAKMAFPDKEVVAVMGDGEFMMTMQDLETAVREKIGVKIVVVNDNSYRVLLMRQKIQKMGRVFGTQHTNPDITKVADAFGALGARVVSDEGIGSAVEFLMEKSEVPRIVELQVDPEDLPPINIQGSLMF